MLQFLKKFWLYSSIIVFIFLFGFPQYKIAHAQDAASILAADIDLFLGGGAQGFFVWQYGGDLNGRRIAVDQFSFYRDANPEICEVLKQKSEQYSGKTIGVNINNIGAVEFTDGTAVEHMTWLKENCGVSAIRIFGKIEGVQGIANAIAAGQQSGVQILVAIGDYSNGGGGVPQGANRDWYEFGYQGEYKSFVSDIVNNFSDNPTIWGFELANEPHCGGDEFAIPAYTNWGRDIGTLLGAASSRVGYGQMASQNSTRCDSPGPGDFETTNSIDQITMTSGHYYTEAEKQNALQALSISQSLGKMFYIGEAPPGELSQEETGDEGGGYNLDIYPEYGVDETKSYITPIRNLLNSGSTQRTVEKLRRELALSGYQAYVIAEELKIKPEYNTEALIAKYLEQYPDGYQELRIDAIESLNFTNAKYPLWRDVSNKQFLLTSLEEYFGFRDVYETDPAWSVVTSSPINSLLSEPQLCVQGWKNLVAQQLACERLLNPAECELLTRPIPDTGFTVATLLEELATYEPLYREGMSVKGCENLIGPDREANTELLKGLINTPTYFDRSYRYGFVVAVIHSKDPGTLSGNIATKLFNFFSIDTRDLVPRDEVLVAAFKLPDIGTNKGGGDDSGSQFWSDPLDLTRKVLTTKEAQRQHEDVDRDAKRKEILAAAEAASMQSEDSRIYCYEGSFPGGDGTTSCKNELTKAITDIINGGAGDPEEIESVSVITDLAGLDNPEEPYGRIFNQDNGGQVLLNLFMGDWTHWNGSYFDPQKAQSDWLRGDPEEELTSLFTISNQTWPPEVADTTVDFYILYPMGFELEAVEEAMKGAFFTKAQIAALEQENTFGGFEMRGQSMGLSAGSTGWTYIDTVATANQECGTETIYDDDGNPIGEVPKVCEEKVSITIKQDSTGIGILGGSLGYWMRKVQQQLNARTSPAWEYFASCQSTEEFLLGKCRGGDFSGNNSGDDSTVVPGDQLVGVAQCNNTPRIGSGGEANHVDTTGTGACAGADTTRLFVSELHNVANWKNPNDPVMDCDDFLYSYIACNPEYADTLIANPVNSQGKFVNSGNTTACEYVVRVARENGISPRLALAIWGEESGFSAYRVPDFGVISQPAQDIGAQVQTFADIANSHPTYLEFLEAYSGEERGPGDPSPNQFCNNPNFVARLKQFYDYLAP